MQNEVRHTWHYSQSPQEVWDYLTKPELLEQWLMKNDFQPIVGHKFRFTHNGTLHHYCQVTEVKPFTKLSYSWKKDDMPVDSKVTWTLIPKDGGTDLQLVHDGFVVLANYTDHNKGWAMLVPRMAELMNAAKK